MAVVKKLRTGGVPSISSEFDVVPADALESIPTSNPRKQAESYLAKITQQMRNHESTSQAGGKEIKKPSSVKERKEFLEPIQQITGSKVVQIREIIDRCTKKELRYRAEMIAVQTNLREILKLFREHEQNLRGQKQQLYKE